MMGGLEVWGLIITVVSGGVKVNIYFSSLGGFLVDAV